MTVPDGEEELQQPGRHGERPRAQRLRIDLAVGAAILVGALLVAKAISHHGHGSAAGPSRSTGPGVVASAEPEPAASAFVTLPGSDGTIEAHPALPPRTSIDPSACPLHVPCSTDDAVPPAARAAVRDVFPPAARLAATSVVLDGSSYATRLWFRQINATISGAELIVRIQAPYPDDKPTHGRLSEGDITFYSAPVGQYFVSAQITTLQPGALSRITQLVHDARLYLN
jgi:hypothetical protein